MGIYFKENDVMMTEHEVSEVLNNRVEGYCYHLYNMGFVSMKVMRDSGGYNLMKYSKDNYFIPLFGESVMYRLLTISSPVRSREKRVNFNI
jgi:hypothetical protein